METLDEGIRGLDDLDSFFEYLHQVGASHTRIPGFKAEYFWVSCGIAWFLSTQHLDVGHKIGLIRTNAINFMSDSVIHLLNERPTG